MFALCWVLCIPVVFVWCLLPWPVRCVGGELCMWSCERSSGARVYILFYLSRARARSRSSLEVEPLYTTRNITAQSQDPPLVHVSLLSPRPSAGEGSSSVDILAPDCST